MEFINTALTINNEIKTKNLNFFLISKKNINNNIDIKCKAVAVLSAEMIIVKVTNRVRKKRFSKKYFFYGKIKQTIPTNNGNNLEKNFPKLIHP